MPGQSQPDSSITYIHNNPASLKSQVLQTVMAILGKKKSMEKRIKSRKFLTAATEIPTILKADYLLRTDEVNQRKVWTFRPQKDIVQKVILYIHGGGYITNLLKYDWDFIHALLEETKCTVVVPDYPLAPVSNYQDVYLFFEELYSILKAEKPTEDIIFMGNSAGGGFALGFAQKLRDNNLPQPSQIILNSPWLDITMSNPEIMELDKNDKLLGIEGLKLAGQAYSAGLDQKNHKVSPIYGNLTGLGPISIFIGTHDLFLADARKLKEKLRAQNIPVNYFEYPKMFHVWMVLTSLKESQHAIKQIGKLIRKNY